MKGRILPLLLMVLFLCPGSYLGFVFYGPPAYRPQEMALEPVCMEVNGTVQPVGVTSIRTNIYNNTSYFVDYAHEFVLEERQSGSWKRFDEAEITIYFLGGFTIFPHQEAESIEPVDVYTIREGVGLRAGEYRIRREANIITDYGRKIAGPLTLYAEFIVK